jgi:uncharacterized protein YbaR (Trm112 family)
VAILACPVCKGFVNFVLEKLRVFRDMGGMAVPAIHQVTTDVDVRRTERSLFVIMAFSA